jgi:hypothetical protein
MTRQITSASEKIPVPVDDVAAEQALRAGTPDTCEGRSGISVSLKRCTMSLIEKQFIRRES